MLQQTRVETVIPYYARFLEQFPGVESLAQAPEPALLAAWAGLGYYSRVRNMQRAARAICEAGEFPRDYAAIRELPGIGDYTAAAVASIAFDLPHAVLDGNVMRVLARVTAEPGDIRAPSTRKRLQAAADERLDRDRPGEFNQAMMELGATVCAAADPKCLLCPVSAYCEARKSGRAREFPIKSRPVDRVPAAVTLLIIERDGHLLLWQRTPESKRLAGFWELPDPSRLPGAKLGESLGEFRHSITNTDYTIAVRRAVIARTPELHEWIAVSRLAEIPLSTTARKALRNSAIL